MEKVEPVVKNRRLTKKKRIKRRKRLGLDKESEARKTQEFCLKVNERTQNLEEFLKLTGRKPEQRLLEIGNVAKNQQNKRNEGIEDTVRRFGAEADHGDSAILVFLTHGCVDGVYGTDGKVFQLNQVFVLLSPENSPQLALKPKLIFVESCRGSNRDAGYSVVEDPGEDQVLERSGVDSAGEKVGEKPKTIPMNSDFLISYSTSPGHVAFAHPRFGAYHVQLLCRTIAERAHQDDLETMMVAVRKGISQMEFRGEKGLLKQMPEHRSTLRMTFYFNLEGRAKKQ